ADASPPPLHDALPISHLLDQAEVAPARLERAIAVQPGGALEEHLARAALVEVRLRSAPALPLVLLAGAEVDAVVGEVIRHRLDRRLDSQAAPHQDAGAVLLDQLA